MKRNRWIAALTVLLVAVVAAMVTGCGSSSGGTTTTGTSGAPKQGGTLRVAWQGEPTGLDPAIAWEVESMGMENMLFNGLLKYASGSGDAGAKLAGDLATEVPVPTNNGLTYTFHLRQGIKFAPPVNRAVTADDVKWSIERMMRLPKAPAGYFYEGIVGATAYTADKSKATEITGIKVVDPSTIEFDLTQADPAFLNKIAMPFCYVVDKATVAQYGTQVNHHPVGTGPFTMESWTPGQEIVMKRNPNYFDAANVHLDGIDFTFSADPQTALLKLERGDIDVLGDGVPAASYAQTVANPTWKDQVIDSPQVAWFYLFLNTQIKPFDNLQVRQAVNYAVNTAKLQKVLAGTAQALNQIFPAGMPGHDDKATFYTYDPAKAKALLAQAGFPNGFKTTIYTHNVDPFPRVTQSVQYDLQQVGIQATIKQMDRATYWTLIATKGNPCPIGLTDWYMDFPDPSDWYAPLLSKAAAETDGGSNQSWWYSPQAEALYTQTQTETDQAKRVALFQQMQTIIMEQAPVVPLFQPVFNAMSSKNVGGFYVHPVWQLKYDDFWMK
jgi:oligopeptide transport system substrate-binding protein